MSQETFYKSCDNCERHCRIMLWADNAEDILLTSGECLCGDRDCRSRWGTRYVGSEFDDRYWKKFGEPQSYLTQLKCKECDHECEFDIYGPPPLHIKAGCPFLKGPVRFYVEKGEI